MGPNATLPTALHKRPLVIEFVGTHRDRADAEHLAVLIGLLQGHAVFRLCDGIVESDLRA